MRIFAAVLLLASLASCDLTVGDDCGPFPERSQFALNDTAAMRWSADAMRVAVPRRVGTVEITQWAHADSIRVIATHRGESSFDTLVFEHIVIDTLLQLRLARASEITGAKGASVECIPAPDPSFETDLKIFAPEGLSVTYGQLF
jgi:hypothetical protein